MTCFERTLSIIGKKLSSITLFLNILNYIIVTLEHPGVKAPGTPKTIIFLFAATTAKFTVFVGLSS